MSSSKEFKPVEFLIVELKELNFGEALLFDMPTGFGKTRAIINYINYSISNSLNENIVIVTNLKKDLIELESKLGQNLQYVKTFTFDEFLNQSFENALIFIDEFDSSKGFIKSFDAEKLIASKLIDNRVVLVSATIKIYTTYDSYNFDILGECIKIKSLRAEFVELLRLESNIRNQYYKDIDINVVFEDLTLDSAIEKFKTLNIYSFLYLKDDKKELRYEEKKGLFSLNLDNFINIFPRIKERLYSGRETFVIANFSSVNAGQNIQYEIPKKIKDSLNLVTLYPKKREVIKKDFDSIYIDFPFGASCLNRSVKNYLIKLVIQSIGRINKTNLKSKRVYIFLHHRYRELLREFDFSDFILLEELRSVVEIAKS
jgi:hypothetical protein